MLLAKLKQKKTEFQKLDKVIRENIPVGSLDWNGSAPHGAGRKMKRETVREQFTVSQFKAEMKGVYSSCIGKGTLDEAPFAYRNLQEIEENIVDTVDIRQRIRTIYNFKAGAEK